MGVQHIIYTKQQMADMEVCGYSVYVNEQYWASYDDTKSVVKEVNRYKAYNQVEIYPILRKETTMSKVKEHMMQQQQEEFELELSYQEWLMQNTVEPEEDELYEMEQDYLQKQSHFVSNQIIAQQHLNNINYTPKQGA